MMLDQDVALDPRLRAVAAAQPYPLLFLTVGGAHLYGFPSPDSDFDLRGVHVLPAREVLGLAGGRDTIETSRTHEGLELDLVTHDLKKFALMMLKKNGYVLEQVLSPLVFQTTPEHEELKAFASRCVTRYHAYHYLGFARSEWQLFAKRHPPQVKPLLYVYRVLLTGIHLMRTGEIEANLSRLNDMFHLPYVSDLIDRKRVAGEQAILDEVDLSFHEQEYGRLREMLERAHESSTLPERPTGKAALHDLIVRVRLETI